MYVSQRGTLHVSPPTLQHHVHSTCREHHVHPTNSVTCALCTHPRRHWRIPHTVLLALSVGLTPAPSNTSMMTITTTTTTAETVTHSVRHIWLWHIYVVWLLLCLCIHACAYMPSSIRLCLFQYRFCARLFNALLRLQTEGHVHAYAEGQFSGAPLLSVYA